MIPPIWWQIIRNWSSLHCADYNSMMTGRNPGRNISRFTHKNSKKRRTIRNNHIYCFRNLILRIVLLSILPYKIIANNWATIDLTTYRKTTIQSYTSRWSTWPTIAGKLDRHHVPAVGSISPSVHCEPHSVRLQNFPNTCPYRSDFKIKLLSKIRY